MLKKIFSLILTLAMVVSLGTTVSASQVVSAGDVGQLTAVYENLMSYAEEHFIPLDMSFETFIQEYENGSYLNIAEYEEAYYKILKAPKGFPRAPRNAGIDKWYYNSGTSLPQAADYSKYNLLNVVKKGDIIFEAKGGFGITAHIAIVEGIYYDSTYDQYFIRSIESIDKGVVRSVLDDERVVDKDVTVLRVSSASSDQVNGAVDFVIGQLGKPYKLDFAKDTSSSEPDWYCSELVWAAYYNEGINIETTNIINEPGITPRDIKNSKMVSAVSFR